MDTSSLTRFAQSYQFGWFVGVVLDFIVRAFLGDAAADGLEDAICDTKHHNGQSSVG